MEKRTRLKIAVHVLLGPFTIGGGELAQLVSPGLDLNFTDSLHKKMENENGNLHNYPSLDHHPELQNAD